MRFIITARPGPDSPEPPDPNGPFDEALFSAYMKFNEEMHKAGVLVAAEGLKPEGNVVRVYDDLAPAQRLLDAGAPEAAAAGVPLEEFLTSIAPRA